MRAPSIIALVLPSLILAGASSAAPEAAKPAAPEAAKPAAPAAAAGAKVVGPPEVAWKDMTPEQKGKFMKAVVTPKMKPLFQAFDGDEFKKFGCDTCHGKDAKARKFKMPGPDVHELPSTPEAFQAALKTKPSWPKWTKFMSEKVEPQMATLLGLPSFDPKKPEAGGFSCEGCHRLEGKKYP